MLSLLPGWIDTAGRTRTWKLVRSDGSTLAEVTTKRAALLLLTLLTNAA